MSNLVSRLSSSARRRKRLLNFALNPCLLLWAPLTLAATWALVATPHTGSLLIGVPVLVLLFYYLVENLGQAWSGGYERLVIKTNLDVQAEIESSLYEICLSFGSGHALLESIEVIDAICMENDLRRLSSFLEESVTGAIYSINDMSNVMQSLHSLLSSQEGKRRPIENRQLIVEDLGNFNATLLSLKVVDSKVCLSLLSQSWWNQALHIDYRRNGYCI